MNEGFAIHTNGYSPRRAGNGPGDLREPAKALVENSSGSIERHPVPVRMRKQKLIVVNGLPASGKTTLAEYLSRELHLPMFNKDGFKELLSDSMGVTSVRGSRRFEDPSYALLFYISRTLLANRFSVIIEGNFHPGQDITELGKRLGDSGVTVVEIFCRARGDLLIERFGERLNQRHLIHPRIMPPRFIRTLRENAFSSLNIGEVLEVDTSDFSKISYKNIIRFIKK